jgi:hypothetical protein
VNRRSRGILVRAAVAALLAAAAFAAPTAIHASASVDLLAFDSVDDFIGQGATLSVDDSEASFGVYGLTTPSRLVLYVSALDGQYWFLEFDAPLGQALHVGSYPHAARPQPLGQPAISIWGNGRGCNTSTGDFTILDLATDGSGVPTSAAIAFDQSCDSDFGLLAGRIRVGSTVPIASLSLPHASRVFENTVAGTSATPRTYMMSADGDVPVTIGSLAVGGADASEFPLLSDDCSGRVLAPGDDCVYSVGFAPTAAAMRTAVLSVPSDLPNAPRQVPVEGWGLIPTSTTVAIVPDATYLPHGIIYEVHVSPNPASGFVTCLVDEAPLPGGVVDQNGVGRCYGTRVLGSHTFVGGYRENSLYGGSTSALFAFNVSSTTVLSLAAHPADGAGTVVSATIGTASSLLYPGGTLTVRDDTTGLTLGTLAIDSAHPALSITANLAVGAHHLSAAFDGVSGVLDASSVSLDVVVLKAPTTPSSRFPSSSTLGTSTVPLAFRWAAPTATVIDHFDVSLSTDGHAYRVLGSTSSTSFTSSVSPGHTYRFRVRARDGSGNGSAWIYSSSSRVLASSETSSAILYAGAWHGVRSATYFGKADEYSTSAGSTARFRFTGKAVAWVSSFGPTRGSVRVYLDGRFVATVNLYAPTTQFRRIAWTAVFASSGSHVLTLRIVGTHGHPRGDVDAFLVTS